MRYIFSEEQVVVPDDVSMKIRSRIVTVEGPRGKLTKDLSHIAVTFTLPEKKNKDGKQVLNVNIHHGSRKNVATLRTVKSIIDNLITGVTKGYKYKMRYVYAHFPINVNIEKTDDGRQNVEIRNFLGEKLVRYVKMLDGVNVEPSKGVKDQIEITGNSLENVSQSAADIQQICRVRNKDIRKFLDGLYVSERGNITED
ncbi:60S ribosomal protein L9B [Neophaeococcomyces mojaviensis]|uniref:60S ribosomal protein L9B n=1 Tax=Neophaeococcomyces mojaviensis TaxID=3383035 RepID=A0ACC3ADR8_9EURO|nr:60S ribosomal protein L9B [Knufia sp. JES_112]